MNATTTPTTIERTAMERIVMLETQVVELRKAFAHTAMQIVDLAALLARVSESQAMLARMHIMQQEALPGEFVGGLGGNTKAN